MRGDTRIRLRGNPRGFTLIEVLMAMMVLSIGLASVLSVFIVGLRSSRRVVDESAAAVAAKAVLARVLYQDDRPQDGTGTGANGDGVRDYLELIAVARGDGESPACDWVWIHDLDDMAAGSGSNIDDSAIPAPMPVAAGSRFSWRCRASRFRGVPGKPRQDLVVNSSPAALIDGRIPQSQERNPDSDEMWRLLIEVYRDYTNGMSPLAEFETYVCMAHR